MSQRNNRWTIRRRGKSWQVDFGIITGKRTQKSFKTKGEAEDWAKQKQKEHDQGRFAAFGMTDRQRFDALAAYEKLSSLIKLPVTDLPAPGVSLQIVTDFYAKHAKPAGAQRTFRELCDDYLKTKEAAGRRPKTLFDLRHRFKRICTKFGTTPVHTVTTQDIEKWLDDNAYKGVTRRDYRTHFVMLFNFARKRKVAESNPAEDVEVPTLDEKMPTVLTVDQCDQLMQAVRTQTPEMVPYFAIALFAGLRPTEAEQVDWAQINFESRVIKVIPETAKKRRLRFVDMSGNLIEWLLPSRQPAGRIFFSRKRFDLARRLSGVPWSNDVLRHSFASYHLALHENVAKTSMQLGHRNADVLFNHYRDLVRREDAQKFWEIRPAHEAAVLTIPIPATA